MKKMFYVLCMFCATAYYTQAQTVFKKVLNAGSNDFQEIIATADSGYLAVGQAAADITTRSTTGFLVVKMDAGFRIVWSYAYNVANEFQKGKIKIAAIQGNRYTIVSNLSTDSGATVSKICAFTINNTGKVVWSKEIAMASQIRTANAITVTNENNVIITGLNEQDLSGKLSKVYAVCLKGNSGALVWQKLYAMLGGAQAGEQIVRSSGNIFIISGVSDLKPVNLKINASGTSLGAVALSVPDTLYTQDALSLKDNSLLVSGYIITKGYYGKSFVSKFDSAGQVLWTRYTRQLSNPHLLEDGNTYLLSGDDTTFSGNATHTSLVRLSTTGQLIGNEVLLDKSPGYSSRSFKVIKTADMGYVIAGKLDTAASGGSFAYLTKADSAFNTCGNVSIPVIKYKNYPSTSASVKVKTANDSALVTDVALLIQQAPKFTSICEGGSPSVAPQLAATVAAVANNYAAIVVYPNPVNSVLIVKGLNGAVTKNLSIIDMNGRTVATAATHDAMYKWNVQQLTNGIYYLKILQDNKVIVLHFVKQ